MKRVSKGGGVIGQLSGVELIGDAGSEGSKWKRYCGARNSDAFLYISHVIPIWHSQSFGDCRLRFVTITAFGGGLCQAYQWVTRLHVFAQRTGTSIGCTNRLPAVIAFTMLQLPTTNFEEVTNTRSTPQWENCL